MYNIGYNEKKERNIQAWLAAQGPSHNERQWVEISDDEESMSQMPSVFQGVGSKAQQTPPLDLSVFEKGPRQAESPLDLSVKTRKRCADSTDIEELQRRRGVSQGGSLAKRLCMPQAGDQRRMSNYPYETKMSNEGFVTSMPQAKQSGSKYQYLPANPSPLAQSSQHQMGHSYQSVQGYSSHGGIVPAGQARQSQLGHYHASRSRPMDGMRSYDSNQIPKRSPNTVSSTLVGNRRASDELKLQKSETTALQGFYEPSGKHTLTMSASNPEFPPTKRDTPVEPVLLSPGQIHYQDSLKRSESAQQLNPSIQNASYPGLQGRQVVISHDSRRLVHQQQQQKQMVQQGKHIQQTGVDHRSPTSVDASDKGHTFGHGHGQMYGPYLTHQAQAVQKAVERERMSQMIVANNLNLMSGLIQVENSQKHIALAPESLVSSNSLMYQQQALADRNISELRPNQPSNITERDRNYGQSSYPGQKVPNVSVTDTSFVMRQPYGKAEQNEYTGYGSSKVVSQNMRTNVLRDVISPASSHINASPVAMRQDSRHEVQRNIHTHPSQSVIQRQGGHIDPRHIQDRNSVLSSSGHTYQNTLFDRITSDKPMSFSNTHNPRYNIDHKDVRHVSSSKDQSYIAKMPSQSQETHPPRSRQLAFHTSRGREISLVGDNQEALQGRKDIPDSNIHYDSTERQLSRQHRPPYTQQLPQNNIPQGSRNVTVSRRSSVSSQSSRKGISHEYSEHGKRDLPQSSSVRNKPSVPETQSNANLKTSVVDETTVRLAAEMVLPMAKKYGMERSITKGTSGLQKEQKGMDFISALLIEELKRDSEPPEDCFKNRSLLQEIDRSANSSPFKPEKQESESNDIKADISKDDNGEFKNPNTPVPVVSNTDSTSYALPLQIAIPGNKSAQRSSVISSAQIDKAPKVWSRKHMILSAFKHDEDLKNTVNIDKNEKIPVESAKYVSKKGTERTQNESLSVCPPSPKMPILSPQEKNRITPMVSPATGDPPNLVDNNTTNAQGNLEQTPTKEIKSLEQHLHKLISDAVKSQGSFDKEKVCETVYRLTSQPQPHKPFITRQLSTSKNIPVANVAPFVHGKFASNEFKMAETSESSMEQKPESDAYKVDTETFDEEKKSHEANIVDDLDRSTSLGKYSSFESPNHPDAVCNFVNVESENRFKVSDIDLDNSNSNLSFQTQSFGNLFDEDSNASRMSPSMKKLMLHRHQSSKGADDFNDDDDDSFGFLSNLPKVSTSPKQEVRNVFGSFEEILSENRITSDGEDKLESDEEEESRLSDLKLDSNTGYDGDDEGKKDKHVKGKTKQSNTRQKADKLVKRARLSKNLKTDGSKSSVKSRLHRKNLIQKGFVDFMPEVLPQRTRTGRNARSALRSGKLKDKSRESRRSSSHGPFRGKTKVALEPRSNSTGRTLELKKKAKAKLDDIPPAKDTFAYISDTNEAESANEDLTDLKGVKRDKKWKIKGASSTAKQQLRNGKSKGGLMVKLSLRGLPLDDDESTDEEYFQNYEKKFKSFASDNETKKEQKKSVNKKRKGFHFKQKYIFQRKRRPKGKGRGAPRAETAYSKPERPNLDELYSFHEEGYELDAQPTGSYIDTSSQIPVPLEVKRVTVNKDTGETLLHRAARMGYVEVVLYCIATGNVEVNARDNAGYTPLHECCVRGHRPIAIQLLKYGADVNCVSVDGIRPIHDAVENDRLEMVRLLLSYGADPSLSTYAGRTPMKIARTERMKHMLLCYIADLNGYSHDLDVEEKPWQFHGSSHSLDTPEEPGSAIFYDLPSDPEDESPDLCTLNAQPLFPTQRITADGGKRTEDYILLEDILRGYRVTKKELDSQGIPSHMIKTPTKKAFKEAKKDSIYREYFYSKSDDIGIKAIRCVDAAQIIHKIEKHIASTSGHHRTKS